MDEASELGTEIAHDAPESGGFSSVLDDLHRRARRSGDATAYRYIPDAARGSDLSAVLRWTWGDVAARTQAAAAEIAQTLAPAPGDRILLAYPAGLEFIAAFLGCLQAGAIPVPVAPPRRQEANRWQRIQRDCAAIGLLLGASVQDRLSAAEPSVPQIMLTSVDPARPLVGPRPTGSAPPVTADAIAFLQYTSGSTGAPKGVIVTHGMLQANLAQIVGAFDYRPGDRIIGWLPQYHDMGLISGVLLPIHTGIDSTMMSPAAFLRDPLRFLELAGRIRARGLGGPNFAFEHCLAKATPEALARIDLSALRVAFNGAEPIRDDTVTRFQQTFAACGLRPEAMVNCYGMAEAVLCVAVSPLHGAPRCAPPAVAADALPSRPVAESGVAVAGLSIAIVDAQRRRALAMGRPAKSGCAGQMSPRATGASPSSMPRPSISG